MVCGVQCSDDTTRKGWSWVGQGGAPQLSQETTPPSQEGVLRGVGLRLAQKGWDGVP